ncbi:Putative lipoprotein OS=Castellaniella defragrans (strain DSM / CCUG 39792 / 65Phen) OX=1437824 GN=BN940_01931 PE=4 SV=1 [Castellaniella denitrificans]
MNAIAGVRIRGPLTGAGADGLPAWLSDGRWAADVEETRGIDAQGAYRDFRLARDAAGRWAPGGDTTEIARALALDPQAREPDLEKEIFVALLLSPVRFDFPSAAELAAAVRVRRRIVQAARRTVLAFDTEQAERPDCWSWTEETGFILKPGHELVPSLERTLWPDLSGRLFSFSCYRATEYVLLLALAQELAESHPSALGALQCQWRTKAIQSGAFHDVFLREYGSLQAPLPPRYYVPGDRLWFRNPDAASAEVEGYEGSWVFYLGSGRFRPTISSGAMSRLRSWITVRLP